MKHTIEFDLTSPDGLEDLKNAQRASEMALALHDLYTYLRAQVKYADPPASALAIKDEFHRILEERGLDDLI